MVGQICIGNCESLYCHILFCFVRNRACSKIFCTAVISTLRTFVLIWKLAQTGWRSPKTRFSAGYIIGALSSLSFCFPAVRKFISSDGTYIMPCPVASLSIAVYSGYQKKNKLLLALLTIWGLTGIKSLIFNAYEDIILLVCGLYGVVFLFKEIRVHRKEADDKSVGRWFVWNVKEYK